MGCSPDDKRAEVFTAYQGFTWTLPWRLKVGSEVVGWDPDTFVVQILRGRTVVASSIEDDGLPTIGIAPDWDADPKELTLTLDDSENPVPTDDEPGIAVSSSYTLGVSVEIDGEPKPVMIEPFRVAAAPVVLPVAP